MTNTLNERLKANPHEGVIVFFTMLVVGGAIWTKLLAPPRPLLGILTDFGFWFVVLLLGIPASVVYLVSATRAN